MARPPTPHPDDGRWQLFVKTDRSYRVRADPEDRVSTLKLKVKAKIGTPVHLQRLIARGISLVDDSMTLQAREAMLLTLTATLTLTAALTRT